MKPNPVSLRRRRHTEHLSLMGGDVIPHFTGADNNGEAFAAMNIFPPGSGVPLHTHGLEDEVFHVLDGELEITLGTAKRTLVAGESAFLPRAVPHAWQVSGPGSARFLLVVTPAGLEQMFRELAALPDGPPDMNTVSRICSRYGVEFI